MGGKAFGFDAKRMSKTEYNFVLEKMLRKIQSSQDVSGDIAEGVISVKDKDSFGDIDILIMKDKFSFERFWNMHNKDFVGFKKNGGVISLLDFENRQIDLILTDIGIFGTHFDYLAYNDLGNFVGRLARAVGLKYGHDGLSLVVRDPSDSNRIINIIKVSENTGVIYKLLGLSIPKSFNSMQDVYSFIMSSKYYHKDSFLLEKQSGKARVRDKKRKSYRGMLEYIKENDTSSTERRKYTTFETLSLLPDNVKLRYIDIVSEHDQKKYESSLFNGNIVMDVTGLRGKELGIFMASIRGKVDLSSDVKSQVFQMFKEYDRTE